MMIAAGGGLNRKPLFHRILVRFEYFVVRNELSGYSIGNAPLFVFLDKPRLYCYMITYKNQYVNTYVASGAGRAFSVLNVFIDR